MPRIIIKFFGPARDLVGEAEISIEIGEGETVGAVAGRLAEQYPALGDALGVRLAVNRAYVPLDRALSDGDEIAVIPPVSGGAPAARARLTREPVDLDAIVAELRTDEAGAVVLFAGAVRAESRDDTALTALDYHAYEEMAVEQMEVILAKARQDHDILDAAVIHRLGRIEIGESSIGIAVFAAHRGPAFDACRWIIDRVKADVPIWKKDIWGNGSRTWVDATK